MEFGLPQLALLLVACLAAGYWALSFPKRHLPENKVKDRPRRAAAILSTQATHQSRQPPGPTRPVPEPASASASASASAANGKLQRFRGKAYIVDGDTIRVKKQRIRLWAMDAPEMDQQGGKKSKSHLIRIAGGREVDVEPITTDCYGRIVARVWLGRHDLSARMVREGYAVATSRYQKDYDSLELQARRDRCGLWASGPRSGGGISDPAAHRRWKARETDPAGAGTATVSHSKVVSIDPGRRTGTGA